MVKEQISDICLKFRSERQAELDDKGGSYVCVPPTNTEVFKQAYGLAPSAAQVLLAYFYRSAVTKSETVSFTKSLAQRFGMDPSHARRTVHKLVGAGVFKRVENGKKSITIQANWAKRTRLAKRS